MYLTVLSGKSAFRYTTLFLRFKRLPLDLRLTFEF